MSEKTPVTTEEWFTKSCQCLMATGQTKSK